MLSQTLRQEFLKYFRERKHQVVSSSPVVPYDDPTLLFTNAGMNQFKDVFLGKTRRDYTRAATSQKCIRVGGKHNDLDNVGHTSRHLTFFEMLGNFSFGDYFKKEAIQFAWEVSTKVFGLNPDRIWPTVFREDDEAFELWKAYVPESRITRFGEKDNFWAMGDTGPCGPCSELLYDRGDKYGEAKSPLEDPNGERFLEFWNLVFMQYNRLSPNEIITLPKPSIDTGAGLERLLSLKMEVDSVFETDVLRSLIDKIEQESNVTYQLNDPIKAPAFRVIADHLRCLSFSIADGVQPSNVDRGYVLRKVLRRAVRYGKTLGFTKPFLADIYPRLMETMGRDYPELVKSQNRITEILHLEEEAFLKTLQRGGNILQNIIDHASSSNLRQISGEEAFKLKDTYGFPFEEIVLIAKDANLQVDFNRYQELEEEAKKRSRSTQKTVQQIANESIFEEVIEKHGLTEFVGYTLHNTSSQVLAIVYEGQLVPQLKTGQEGWIILDKTPFYAEMGGQVGDLGMLRSEHKLFSVVNTITPFKGIVAHVGQMEKNEINVGDYLNASIDSSRRQKIANNHTATHLLHWALNQVLGEHIKQAGSVVDENRLRFDFSHHKSLSKQEIQTLEDLVNAKIRENKPVKWYEIGYEEAQSRNDIKMFFDEKYGNKVRVIDIDESKELCGGTHTSQTGNIGLFKILKEGSIAAGIRRIEAVTGQEAENLAKDLESTITTIADLLKVPSPKILEKIERLLEENKKLSLDLKNVKKSELENLAKRLVEKIEIVKEIPFISSKVSLPPDELRLFIDEVTNRFRTGVLVVGSEYDQKCQIIAKVSDDLVQKGIQAHTIIKGIAPLIEGTGGGKANMAQAGGKNPQRLDEALCKAKEYI
ncbi:Alanine--tRNA ligase [Candidatus Rubidus massiliensis]|nr:Alanine--tRNA ligase [Candidatus Rubidus massiliensis]